MRAMPSARGERRPLEARQRGVVLEIGKPAQRPMWIAGVRYLLRPEALQLVLPGAAQRLQASQLAGGEAVTAGRAGQRGADQPREQLVAARARAQARNARQLLIDRPHVHDRRLLRAHGPTGTHYMTRMKKVASRKAIEAERSGQSSGNVGCNKLKAHC